MCECLEMRHYGRKGKWLQDAWIAVVFKGNWHHLFLEQGFICCTQDTHVIRRHARSTWGEIVRRRLAQILLFFPMHFANAWLCEDPISSRTETCVDLFRLALLTMAACGLETSVFVERESWLALRKVPSFCRKTETAYRPESSDSVDRRKLSRSILPPRHWVSPNNNNDDVTNYEARVSTGRDVCSFAILYFI